MASTTFTQGTVAAIEWWQDVNNVAYGNLSTITYVKNYGNTMLAVQQALDAASVNGGVVICEKGATYTGSFLPVIPTKVTLDMNGATFNATLGSGNIYGVRLGSYSTICNGTINVTSTGSPSSQFIFHACISIGEANSNGGTVASPGQYTTVQNFLIENMVLSTTRQYCPVVQGMGNIFNGIIRNITIPDSSTCSGIHLDWSDVGSPVASSDITGTRSAFDLGNCYTTHPHNILIENIKAGNLSVPSYNDLGSSLVRLSACYNIAVKNIECESVTNAAYLHVGGDLGFEFAPASVKPYACKGNTVEQVTIRNPSTDMLYGIYIDTFADNIYREQFVDAAYVPLLDPIMQGDVVVQNVSISGAFTASKQGIRIIQARGVKVNGGSVAKTDVGIWVDEFTSDITISNVTITGCRSHGIKIGEQGLREDTKNILVEKCYIYGNGISTTGYGIYLARGRWCRLLNNSLGTENESTQQCGIVLADAGYNYQNRVVGNHCHGATAAAYSTGGSAAPYYLDQILEWDRNTANLSIQQNPIVTSQSQLPIRSLQFFNRLAKEYITNDTGDPSIGHWVRHSRLFLWDVTANTPAIKNVVSSGSFGTLSGISNASTTNGSKVITMSLAEKTATGSAGEYSVVVNNTTNLRVGLLCSITGGVSNARILSINGLTLQLDKPIKAVSGAAFITAGVVEGEVISINTTPSISGAVVTKINGTSVTLDVAAGSSETSRTVLYSTPVFKSHSSIAA